MGRPPKAIDTTTQAGRLGAAIRAIRLKRKKRAEDIADAISTPLATYYDWETGRRTPAAIDLAKLAQALRTSMQRLLAPPPVVAAKPPATKSSRPRKSA
jgi:transcriptional regulator with XRE-family HTH domain